MAKGFFKRLLGKQQKDRSEPEAKNSESAIPGNEDLFGAITDLASQSRSQIQPVINRPSDLSVISPGDFEQPFIPAETNAKIEELNGIIMNIESRPAYEQYQPLQKKFKINYTALLNPAQLSAV